MRQVVERLRSAAIERARLRDEVGRLEAKLKDAPGTRSTAGTEAGVRAEKVPAALVESLREAIRELREA